MAGAVSMADRLRPVQWAPSDRGCIFYRAGVEIPIRGRLQDAGGYRMQFLMTVKSDPSQPQPTPELMAAMDQLTQKTMKAGVMLQTGGMANDGKVVHLSL